MSRQVSKGATDVTIYLSIQDSTSTTGGKKTGLAFDTAGLTAYYTRQRAAAVAITLATQTVTGAHSDGGFVEVSATNTPGLYRLDLPDAVVATGVDGVVVTLKGATGMVQVDYEIELVAPIMTTAMVESYAADGVAPTLEQALFLIQQMLAERSISGTTLTVKKLDGTTTAATFTLDSATVPTSQTRAT